MRGVFYFCLLGAIAAYGGDDVNEFQELVGANSRGDFLLLEKWQVEGSQSPTPFPMFYGVFRSSGALTDFATIPLLAGLPRGGLDETSEKKAKNKWEELHKVFQEAGFSADRVQALNFKTDSRGYATVELPDGSHIEERGRALPRKKGALQQETVSLWRKPKGGASAVLVKESALQTIVRSFSQRALQKAYWLREKNTVVGLYTNPSSSPVEREKDLWVVEIR